MERTLYIIAYDITNERRLNNTRDLLKGYSTGGQKSAYECFLTDGELRLLMSALDRLLLPSEDRAHIFRVDGRSRAVTFGIAVPPKDPDYFYIG